MGMSHPAQDRMTLSASLRAGRLRLFGLLILLALVWSSAPSAERMGYPPEEFTARRQRLAKAIGSGTIVMFGATSPQAGLRFRQDLSLIHI